MTMIEVAPRGKLVAQSLILNIFETAPGKRKVNARRWHARDKAHQKAVNAEVKQ